MEQRNPTFKELQKWQKWLFAIAISLMIAYLFLGESWAGTTGTEFTTVLTLVTGWIKGLLGKTLAVIALIMGVIAMVGGNVKAGISSLAVFVVILVGPGIVDSMFTAII